MENKHTVNLVSEMWRHYRSLENVFLDNFDKDDSSLLNNFQENVQPLDFEVSRLLIGCLGLIM